MRFKILIGLCATLGPVYAADAAYLYDFQFDANGSYGPTEIIYYAPSLSSSTLSYVSGSVNGYSPDTLENYTQNSGQTFQAMNQVNDPGAVDGIIFALNAKITTTGTYTTTEAARAISGGPYVSNYNYAGGSLTVSSLPYVYDFHFDANGSYGSTDIIYSAPSLSSSTLSYVSGSVNGYSPDTLENYAQNSGQTFQAMNQVNDPGAVDGIIFALNAKITTTGTYTTTEAARAISGGPYVSNYNYAGGSLTVSSPPPSAVPEPATWAMIVLGMGAAGLAMRRRTPIARRVLYAR